MIYLFNENIPHTFRFFFVRLAVTAGVVLTLQGCVAPQNVVIRSSGGGQYGPQNNGVEGRVITSKKKFKGWDVFVHRGKQSGNLTSCSAGLRNDRGIFFGVGLNVNLGFNIAVGNPQWTFTRNEEIAAIHTFSSNKAVSSWWLAYDEHGIVRNWNSGDRVMRDVLIRARNVSVSVAGVHSYVRLEHMGDLVRELENCVAQDLPKTRVAPSNPFAPNPKLPSRNPFQGGAPKEDRPSQYWDKRMNEFADDMLAEAGFSDARRMPVSNLPSGFDDFEAAWRFRDVIGAALHKMGAIGPDVGATVVANLNRVCDGKSASRTEQRRLPNDGVVHRIVSKCNGADRQTVVLTLYPLSDMEAYYLVFHRSFVPGRAEEMDERIYTVIVEGVAGSMGLGAK